MMTDGSRRRVKSGLTKARRTVPDWSTRNVPRPQVGITQLIMGIDADRLHLGVNPGVGRVLLVNIESTAKRVEASSRRPDRHDSDSKRHV